MHMPKALFGYFTVALGLLVFTPLAVRADSTSTTHNSLLVTDSPVILQMADGRFYHPASGQVAATRKDLMNLLYPGTQNTQPGTIDSDAPSSTLNAPQETFPLREAIIKARAQLAQDLPEKHTVHSWDGWGKMTIAVFDKTTNELLMLDAMKRAEKLTILTPGWSIPIRVLRSNGVNSTFKLDEAGRYAMVAVRYPLYAERVISKKKSVYDVETVVYTPYSSALHNREMVAWGKDYLQSMVNGVYQELNDQQIHSWAFPDKTLAQVVDPTVAKSVSVIEHVDHHALEEDPNRTIERFLITLATNQDKAYAYSKSTADARGLAQFIPTTYKTLVKQRPELGLNPDFIKGMQDTENATKAQVAYLDQLIAAMPGETRALYVEELQRPRIYEYVVAAYNGGPGRVKRAIEEWDEQWSPERQTQIQKLQSRSGQLAGSIKSLNAKIKKATVAKTKTKLKQDLAKAKKEQATVHAQVHALKAKTLKQETLTYILKYRKVIKAFEDSSLGFGA